MKKVQVEDLNEQIRVNFSRRSISGVVKAFSINQGESIVFYIPSLQITGYGATIKEAKEMTSFVLNDYFENLFQQPKQAIKAELKELGFTQRSFFTKRFERSTIDMAGILRDFELDFDTLVEESILQLN